MTTDALSDLIRRARPIGSSISFDQRAWCFISTSFALSNACLVVFLEDLGVYWLAEYTEGFVLASVALLTLAVWLGIGTYGYSRISPGFQWVLKIYNLLALLVSVPLFLALAGSILGIFLAGLALFAAAVFGFRFARSYFTMQRKGR